MLDLELAWWKSRLRPKEQPIERTAYHDGRAVRIKLYEDEFKNPYTGRVYRKAYENKWGDKIEYSEVMTVGVQGLVEGNRDVLDDPDYLNFVLGMLAGF